ncbi:hypothetical protein Ahy_A09g045939 [Arachis hypogaea]|uniref:F-box domain-containing protein n=1 Tax=Arachis hypogaea TaxID=3818 RepID=A0A445BNI8_ARAHY|nr:hypothetical protein Ahy_A09g045939 [Arachis hypogaea]
MDEKMDHISGLPETILHDILSRLPKKDAIKTSVLSKTWRETLYTFPILSICDRGFIRKFSKRKENQPIKAFLDHGKQRLLRFSDPGLVIKEFSLILSLTSFVDLQRMYPDVDQWLKLASECSVQTLKLCLPTLKEDDPCLCYILHPGVIEARSLNNLVLKGRIRFDKEFLNPSVKFSSLCVLSLCYVLFDDKGAINHLISYCPRIEQITLKWCYIYNPSRTKFSFMKSLGMHGLQNLKGVDIQGVEKVCIDAPNIEKIYYGAVSYKPSKISFDSCRNLRALTLMNMKIEFVITNEWFLNLFSKFPFLESLELIECSMFDIINIESGQLKALVLSNCSTMELLEIDTPNLSSFRYYFAGDDLPSISFRQCSSQLEVNVHLHMFPPFLYQLGKFVKQFKPQKFLTSLSLSMRPDDDHYHDWEEEDDPYSFPATFPVPIIKHLVIRSVRGIKSNKYPLLVNRLFHSWYPETISLSLNPSHCSKAFIEFKMLSVVLLKSNSHLFFVKKKKKKQFLYLMPMKTKKQSLYLMPMDMKREKGKSCSYCHHKSKCWLHGFKDVKVTSSVKDDVNVVDFVHLKSILDRLSSSDNINITFRLK